MGLNIQKLRDLMKLHNISQKDLAMMSGVTESAMSRYLSGTRQPKSETLANMATALHTTSNDLLDLQPANEVEEAVSIVARGTSAISKEMKLKLIYSLLESLNKGES